MDKYCWRCGSQLDPKTGLCPKCDKKRKSKNWALEIFIIIAVLVLTVFLAVFFLLRFNIVDLNAFNIFSGGNTFFSKAETEINTIGFQCLDGDFTSKKIEDQQSALTAVEDVADEIGIKNVDQELADCVESNILGNTYYRFQQEYEGIPVYGRSVTVSADDKGSGLMLTGNYLDVNEVDTEPVISDEEALEYARVQYSENTALENAGLAVYSLSNVSPELVWKIYAQNDDTIEYCFISARSGEVVDTESLTYFEAVEGTGEDIDGETQTFTTEKRDNEYYLEDADRAISVYDAHGSTLDYQRCIVDSKDRVYFYNKKTKEFHDKRGRKVEITEGADTYFVIKDKDGNVIDEKGEYGMWLTTKNIFTNVSAVKNESTIWKQKRAVTLMHRVSRIYDYWDEMFGRKGFNGTHGTMNIVYRDFYDGHTTNAYAGTNANNPLAIICFGTQNTLAMDVIAHEYAHTITGTTNGLVYKGESGALNEAYSDIFGEILENWYYGKNDWLHNKNGYKRDLTNPEASGKASYYYGTNWKDTSDTSEKNDNGGVHQNSTVISHAAYLMNTGTEHDSSEATLDMQELAELFYASAQSVPSDCSFSSFAAILQNTAIIMNKQGKLTNEQRDCVRNALVQVGVVPGAVFYTVKPDFELQVYDVNQDLYDNCTVNIKRIDYEVRLQGPNIKSRIPKSTEYVIQEKKPLEISLKSGNYEVVIEDNEKNSIRYTLYITVSSDSNQENLRVYTNFGEAIHRDNLQEPISENITTPQTSSERDIVLVLDTSGSMSGTPIEETRKASEEFVSTILKEDASIGVVTYEQSATRLSDFSQEETWLTETVTNIDSGGGTNIESGLSEAYSMLSNSDAKKKIIVLMSDGEPNEGKQGDDLIEYANQIKDQGVLIYTLGFFENMDGEKGSAQYLMEKMASDGCHYEVASADDLVFFFGDVADQINGQKYIYVRIACPVDVSVTYDGETLSSSEEDICQRTDFGTLTFEENEENLNSWEEEEQDQIKVLRLKEGVDYDLKIEGTGRGLMNYTIGFMDDEGNYDDLRRFENVRITKQTVIDTVAAPEETSILNIDQDGDGKYDLKLRAEKNGYGEAVKTHYLLYIIIGGSVVFVLLSSIVVYKIRKRRKAR